MPALLNDYLNSSENPNAKFNSQFDTSMAMYPLDLMDDKFGGNRMTIYISVNEDSKILKGDSAAPTVPDGTFQRMNSEIQRANLSSGQVFAAVSGSAAVAGAVAGGAAGIAGKIVNVLGAGVAVSAAVGASAAAGAVGIVTAPILGLAASTNRKTRMLKNVISLPLPNNLNTNYGVEWSETDTTLNLIAPSLVSSLGESLAAMKSMSAEQIKNAVAGLGKTGLSTAAAGALAGALPNAVGGGLLSTATGLAYNPRMEQIFKGVGVRTFAMSYKFFARSPDEAKAIANIVYLLKLHMHPEYLDANNFIWLYPSEFDIAYYVGDKENPAIPRHTSCVLTSLSVDYTPGGIVSTFPDGTPVQTDVTMSFRELVELDKELIQEGF